MSGQPSQAVPAVKVDTPSGATLLEVVFRLLLDVLPDCLLDTVDQRPALIDGDRRQTEPHFLDHRVLFGLERKRVGRFDRLEKFALSWIFGCFSRLHGYPPASLSLSPRPSRPR